MCLTLTCAGLICADGAEEAPCLISMQCFKAPVVYPSEIEDERKQQRRADRDRTFSTRWHAQLTQAVQLDNCFVPEYVLRSVIEVIIKVDLHGSAC